MHVPRLNQLPLTAQVALLGMIVLLVGVFFSVNRAIMQQELRSNAAEIPTPLPTRMVMPSVSRSKVQNLH